MMLSRSRTLFITATALVGVLLSAAAGTSQTTSPDLSSPESSVRGFFSAFNARRILDAAVYVSGATVTEDLKAWNAEINRPGDHPSLKLNIIGSRVAGDTAEVEAKVDVIFRNTPQGETKSVIRLRKEEAGWKITPPPLEELRKANAAPDPFSIMLYGMTDPVVFLRAREAARRASCRSNMKQLCTGMMMLLMDWNEKFAVRADAWKGKVMPYIKNETVFRCPDVAPNGKGPVSYSFNHRLQGLKISAVKSPATTVMLYEGAGGKLDFRHAGQAMVGFADGSARGVNAEQAKTLRWTP